VLGRIGDENRISSFSVLGVYVLGLVNVEGRMTRVRSKKLHGLVNRFLLSQVKARVAFEENNFKVKPERRGFGRHGFLSLECLESFSRRSSGNTPAALFVDCIFLLGPLAREFLGG